MTFVRLGNQLLLFVLRVQIAITDFRALQKSCLMPHNFSVLIYENDVNGIK